MEKVKVKILPGGNKAREINQKTNPKMGARHVNYESMLREWEIDLTQFSELTKRNVEPNIEVLAGRILTAIVLPNGKVQLEP